MADSLQVEVVYALPDQVFRQHVRLPRGATVAAALSASTLASEYPQALAGKPRVGVFSGAATLQTVLRDGDRVEVYRPLALDPKEARRRRARN